MAASETGFSCPRDIGTRQRCPPYTGERPKRRGHARHARRSTLCMVVAGYHPPTRTYASHQRATLKPIALGESGWASRVARASQIRTNPRGRRVRHFGARNRIFCYRIRWPEGPPSAWAPPPLAGCALARAARVTRPPACARGVPGLASHSALAPPPPAVARCRGPCAGSWPAPPRSARARRACVPLKCRARAARAAAPA